MDEPTTYDKISKAFDLANELGQLLITLLTDEWVKKWKHRQGLTPAQQAEFNRVQSMCDELDNALSGLHCVSLDPSCNTEAKRQEFIDEYKSYKPVKSYCSIDFPRRE